MVVVRSGETCAIGDADAEGMEQTDALTKATMIGRRNRTGDPPGLTGR